VGRAVARPTKTKSERLLEAQRALEMHLAGIDDVHICAELHISKSTLQRRIRWALQQVVDPTVEEYREEAAARIRLARRTVLEALAERVPVQTFAGPAVDRDGNLVMQRRAGPSETAALVGRLLDAETVEAKLRGGFAPTTVNVKHTVEDAFDRLMAELGANDPAPATERTAPHGQDAPR
jgi:hypothetical protein